MIPKSRLYKIKNIYIIFFDIMRKLCQKRPLSQARVKSFLHAREANKVGADSEASALTCRDADRRREDVKNREDGGRGDRDRQDLIHRERLARDKNQRKRNRDALNQVLDDARQKIVDVHFYILTSDFFDSLRSTTPG